jgi:hypothetical protein
MLSQRAVFRNKAFQLSMLLTMATGQVASAQQPRDYRDVPLADLGIQLVEPRVDPKTGFVVGGRNVTAAIGKLTELNGQPVEDLQQEMRPGINSTKGFLGADEKLLDILAEDNAYVVDQLGLTHQELAKHLHVLGELAFRHQGQEILYHGRRFKLGGATFRGSIDSPFEDGTRTNREASLENLDNGKRLKYSLLVPHMVERYGFYEGHGTPFRVDPRDILAALDFLKPKAAQHGDRK